MAVAAQGTKLAELIDFMDAESAELSLISNPPEGYKDCSECMAGVRSRVISAINEPSTCGKLPDNLPWAPKDEE